VPLGSGEGYLGTGYPGCAGVDPCCGEVISEHPSNLNGTAKTVAVVQQISSEFNALYPEIILRINDMSLPEGGLFDIGNNWAPDHFEHRFGRNADISFKYVSGGACGGVMGELMNYRLRKICKEICSAVLEERERNHFHITVRER